MEEFFDTLAERTGENNNGIGSGGGGINIFIILVIIVCLFLFGITTALAITCYIEKNELERINDETTA